MEKWFSGSVNTEREREEGGWGGEGEKHIDGGREVRRIELSINDIRKFCIILTRRFNFSYISVYIFTYYTHTHIYSAGVIIWHIHYE